MSLVYTSYGRAAVLQEYEGLRPRRFDMARQTALWELWKEGLQVGSLVDCADGERSWYEGVVMELDAEHRTARITYPGFSSRFDTTVPLDPLWLLPRNSVTLPWRRMLEEGGPVEVQVNEHWFPGVVLSVRRREGAGTTVVLRSEEELTRTTHDAEERSGLGPVGTHIDGGGNEFVVATTPRLEEVRWATEAENREALLRCVLLESNARMMLTYVRTKLRYIHNTWNALQPVLPTLPNPMVFVLRARLPWLVPVHESELTETPACMWHVATVMKEDLFRELMEYLP